MVKKERSLIYTEDELELMKAVFSDNEPMLRLVQKVFYKADLSEHEQKMLNDLRQNESLINLINKIFNPKINFERPIGHNLDLLKTIDFSNYAADFKDEIVVRSKTVEMLENSINFLRSQDADNRFDIVNVSYVGKDVTDDDVVFLRARNAYVAHVEIQLSTIKVLSGLRTESVEETLKRLEKDSTK